VSRPERMRREPVDEGTRSLGTPGASSRADDATRIRFVLCSIIA